MAKKLLFLEFILLYVGIPLLFPLGVLVKRPIPFILFAALLMFLVLKRDPNFDQKTFTRLPKGSLKRIKWPLLISVGLFYLMVHFLQPDKLLQFPTERPLIWIIVMVLYPILSALPQEIIFRVFFFHRYRKVFHDENQMIAASAILFGLAHLMFGSWISVLLSVLGGVLFSKTYLETKSLLPAAIEHALYGQLIFTIGLGSYFFHANS